jgi:replicative DNA helicase
MSQKEELDQSLFDLKLEQSVLGTFLVNSVYFQISLADISGEVFCLENHQNFYDLLRFVYDEEGKFDLNRILAEIRFQKKEEEFSNSFIAELFGEADIDNLSDFCKILKAYYLRRSMNLLGNKLLEESKDGEVNPYDLYEESVTALSRVSEQASRIKVITAVKGLKEYITLEPKERKSSGFELLDSRFYGGFFESDLIVIGARPAMGKTAFICSGSYNLASKGKNVLIFSLEMNYEQIYMRHLAMHTKETFASVNSKRFLNQDSFWARFKEFEEKIAPHIFYIDKSGMTYNQIINEIKRLCKQHQFDAIYIDYLQKTLGEASSNVRIEVTNAVQSIKSCAKEVKTPIYLLSQLARKVDDRTIPKPTYADLMESGMIEAEADRVLLLYRPYAYYKVGEGKERFLTDMINGIEQPTQNWGEVIIAKDRHDGVNDGVWMPFDGRRMYWCNFESEITSDYPNPSGNGQRYNDEDSVKSSEFSNPKTPSLDDFESPF